MDYRERLLTEAADSSLDEERRARLIARLDQDRDLCDQVTWTLAHFKANLGPVFLLKLATELEAGAANEGAYEKAITSVVSFPVLEVGEAFADGPAFDRKQGGATA